MIVGNWQAAQPSLPAELGCIESKAVDVEREGPEPGKLALRPSLGLEQGVIARTAGSAVSKQDRDLHRHAGGAGRLGGPSRECSRRDPIAQ